MKRGSFSREREREAASSGALWSDSERPRPARGSMEDERGRERGGDAAQQKTPRPECEESRPLSVEVRSGARGQAGARGGAASLAHSPTPSQSGRASSASGGRRRSGGKFRVRIPRKHSARARAHCRSISPVALIGWVLSSAHPYRQMRRQAFRGARTACVFPAPDSPLPSARRGASVPERTLPWSFPFPLLSRPEPCQ